LKIGVAVRAQIGAVLPTLPLLSALAERGHRVTALQNSEFLAFHPTFPGLHLFDANFPPGSPFVEAVSDHVNQWISTERVNAHAEMAMRIARSRQGGARAQELDRLSDMARPATLNGRLNDLIAASGVWDSPHPSIGIDPRHPSSAQLENNWKYESTLESQVRCLRKVLQEFSMIEALIRDTRPDLLIVDPLVPGGQFAAEHYGIPYISIVHHLLDEEAPGYYLYDRYWKAKDLSAPDCFALEQSPDGFPQWWNLVRSQFKLPPDRRPRTEWPWLPMSTFGTVLLVHPLLRVSNRPLPSYVIASKPEPWHFQGLSTEETSRAIERMRTADPDRLRVVVTAASQWQDDVGLIRAAAEAAATEGWQLTVTVPPGQAVPVADGAFRFVPHRDIMNFADIVISHGGRGSVEAALDCRVPLIVSPLTVETSKIAKRIEALGVGTKVLRSAVSTAALRDAVGCFTTNGDVIRALYDRAYRSATSYCSADDLAELVESGVTFTSERARLTCS
jgi:UDP:flavonoid glycosyltransferase YjiC (YdhE family)